MKKYKNYIIISVVAVILLAVTFVWGGNAPGLKTQSVPVHKTEKKIQINQEKLPEQKTEEPKKIKTDEYKTEPVPEGKPKPTEPQEQKITQEELTCTLSVKCSSVLENTEWLNSEKAELIPSDGIIFPEQSVAFNEGESAFNILLREMKKNKIHLEFTNTPIYNSAYIEGINNLYEFDCGELSGWMYKVNDWFPNYGCSRYKLKKGDKIEFLYTCNLGKDIGGYNDLSQEK